MIELALIRTDGGTQSRAGLDAGTVGAYADLIAKAEDDFVDCPLPPMEAVIDADGVCWLWDGFHRLDAYRRRGASAAPVSVRNGTLNDARWLACAANASHGLPRSNEDKRAAVVLALKTRPDASDRAIADHVGVSPTTVGTIRGELSKLDSCPQPEKRTGKDGKARKAPAPKADPPPVTQAESEATLAARKGAPVSPPATEAGNEAFKAARDLAGVRCALGQSVPPALAPAIQAGERVKKLLNALRACEQEVQALCEGDTGHVLAPALRRACAKKGDGTRFQLDSLRSAVTAVKMSMPYTVCPDCWDAHPGRADVDCQRCHGSGVVTKEVFDATEEAFRHAVENRDRIAALAAGGAA